MDFEVNPLDDDHNLVRLSGRMDSAGVDVVETRFIAAVAASGRHAVVDLSGVDYLASMGIRLFITTAHAMQGRQRRMVLFGARPPVQAVLESMAMDQIIPVAADQQQAVRLLAG